MSPPLSSVLLAMLPASLDADMKEYINGYLSDSPDIYSAEALAEFLAPILQNDDGLDEKQVQKLCESMAAVSVKATALKGGTDTAAAAASILLADGYHNANGDFDDGPRLLHRAITMNEEEAVSKLFSMTSSSGAGGDIRHTAGARSTQKSTVDEKKLRLAEERLVKKREKRGEFLDADGIPIYDPNIKPDIIVNQAKSASSSDSRSKDIRIENFDISFAGNKILVNADLALAYGKRYGMVGKNGIGKSTLLRAIAHKELFVPPHIKILHVEQEAAGDDTTALRSVLEADVERETLIQEELKLNDTLNNPKTSTVESNRASARLKEVYAQLEFIEADKAESRASLILSGLGFSSEQQRASSKTFSGGWRMRLALARALFCKPDLLLADEVTNYLDFPAVVWLEQYFQQWTGTILIVSHDRSFLDAVATDILHLHDGTLDAYRGNFTTFVGTRAERRKNAQREYESQLQYRQHLQAFIDRWRYNANRAGKGLEVVAQAQSKIKILEKLPPLEAPPKDDMDGLGESGAAGDSSTGGKDSGNNNNVYFGFDDPERISPPILQMTDVVFGYTPEKLILKGLSFDLQMDSKVAVVGPNGAGKSTMIKLLVGEVDPISGISHRHGRLRIALFSQHHVDMLDLSQGSVTFLSKKFPGKTEEEYRRILGRYGLSGNSALQPIGTLSGGQKSRVVFAWMAMSNPHVLVLDEPTNHLDMDSIDALARALREFKGGIVIVSHDQQFLDAVCREVWVCDGGKLMRFEGKLGSPDGVVKQYKKSLDVVC